MLLNINFNGLNGLDIIFKWITALPIVLTLLFLVLRLWLYKRWVRLLLSVLFFVNAATAVLCFQPEVHFYGIGAMNVIVGFAVLIVTLRDWTRRR